MFRYEHRVQFYETDLMGIVHHGNYLRFYEEARVAWAHEKGILNYQQPESASHLAVLETQVRHIKPAKFGDVLQIEVQAKLEGIRIVFEYKLWRGEELLSEGRTQHVPLDLNLKLIKPPALIRGLLENEKWIETWLSSLSESPKQPR
ncbi:MAG: acyl-CoA thioesterase [Pseudobdellovibrionaceae bacterium]